MTKYITTPRLVVEPDNQDGKNLDYFDAVLLYSIGAIDLDAEPKAGLISFVRDDGKSLAAAHSAIEPIFDFPECPDMMGGVFDRRPWNQEEGRVF